jgi:hypothetical protein
VKNLRKKLAIVALAVAAIAINVSYEPVAQQAFLCGDWCTEWDECIDGAQDECDICYPTPIGKPYCAES